jgi:SAM-dependent methyltransferase
MNVPPSHHTPTTMSNSSPDSKLLPAAEYWDEVAAGFDSLYTSRWSQLEDLRVVGYLRSLALKPNPVVLDLGCGTGLGLRLLGEAEVSPHYHGIDISPKMLKAFSADRSTAQSVTLTVADLDSYEWTSAAAPDLIMSVFSSMSFCDDRWAALERLARHQRPGDKMFLMALSRYSLARLLHLRIGRHGFCRTRSATSRSCVRAYFDTPSSMRRNLEYMGYEVAVLDGDGPITGLMESRPLWRMNSSLGRALPGLSYTLIAVAEKARNSG